MQIYNDMSSMRAAVSDLNALNSEAERITALSQIAYAPCVKVMRGLDPFSNEYRSQVILLYEAISGRHDYQPSVNELSPYLDSNSDTQGYYDAGSTAFAGDILTAMGQVLISLDAKPGQRILEFGAGEGGIAIEAAKSGCDVTVVDVEPRYLELIERRAHKLGLTINVIKGEFGCDIDGTFDRILFYEAFHHALDHKSVAKKLPSMLSDDGFVVLAGEPVIGSHNEQWRPSLPYPWGLRLDGLSFRAIQAFGWMELGFDQSYFIAMLMRAGFLVTFRYCEINERGSAYIARPYRSQLTLGGDFMMNDDWHPGQGDHRWTAKEEAILPLRKHDREIQITCTNFSPFERNYEIASGDKTCAGRLHFGEQAAVILPGSDNLRIRSEVKQDVELDPRPLGLAIQSVQFL